MNWTPVLLHGEGYIAVKERDLTMGEIRTLCGITVCESCPFNLLDEREETCLLMYPDTWSPKLLQTEIRLKNGEQKAFRDVKYSEHEEYCNRVECPECPALSHCPMCFIPYNYPWEGEE